MTAADPVAEPRPRPARRRATLYGVVAFSGFVVLIGVLQQLAPGGFDISRLTGGVITFDTMVRIGILTTVVVGLNLLMGYAGQVSLGQAAFFGIGAYVSAILTTRADVLGIGVGLANQWWWPWLLIVGGMALAGGVAYLVGRPILKLHGHYLAMATLGLGIIIVIVFRENFGYSLGSRNITGGFDGLYGVPRLRIGSFDLWPVERYYYLVWLVAIVGIVLALNLVRSRSGRALRALHGNELAAETLGIDTARFKVRVLVISAMYASLAGSLFAHFRVAVSPGPFGFAASLELVVMAAVGGMASVWGAPFGVAAVLVVRELLRTHLGSLVGEAGGQQEVVAFGLMLVLIMIFMPEGVIARLKQATRRWRSE